MSGGILILRPEPGASRTEDKARAMGLAPVKTPLFRIHPLSWTPPPAKSFDALILTSANAPRNAGGGLSAYAALPCYAVGESTAAAAREAGFDDVRTGPSDAAALLDLVDRDGVRSALHLCGRDHLPLDGAAFAVEAHCVYAAEAVEALAARSIAAIEEGAVALLHSPRAARLFAALLDAAGMDRGDVTIAAISRAALIAAGPGWCDSAASAVPRDAALLELAAKLCHIDPGNGPGPKT